MLYCGDCLDVLPTLPPASVDAIICDLPYGTTQCKWDATIPFGPLWAAYNRVSKLDAPVVLNCAQPFTFMLICSNLAAFKYGWVWNKRKATGHLFAKKQPMRLTEDIAIFCTGHNLYVPQMTLGKPYKGHGGGGGGKVWGKYGKEREDNSGFRYPNTLIEFPFVSRPIHPTEKPVALIEYLVKTYTNPGDTVLDNCMGSGTTGVACINTGRQFIGIERDPKYFKIAQNRILQAALAKVG